MNIPRRINHITTVGDDIIAALMEHISATTNYAVCSISDYDSCIQLDIGPGRRFHINIFGTDLELVDEETTSHSMFNDLTDPRPRSIFIDLTDPRSLDQLTEALK